MGNTIQELRKNERDEMPNIQIKQKTHTKKITSYIQYDDIYTFLEAFINKSLQKCTEQA